MGLLDVGLQDNGFDPKTQGLLAAAFALMKSGGASRLPVSIGQGVGMAGEAGLNEYQRAIKEARAQKQAEALMELEKQKAAMEKVKMDRALKEQAAIEAFQQEVASGKYTQSSAQQALAGGGGPTPANAGLMANFRPKLDRQAMLLGATKTPGLMKEGLAGLMALDENALKREQSETLLRMKLEETAQARSEKSADQERRDRERFADRQDLMKFGANLRQPPQPPAPIEKTDERGNTKIFDRSGNLIKDLGMVGKPSVGFAKGAAAKKKTGQDIDMAITELEKATVDGGLIDKSTGSGAGALVDMAAGFVGKATPGAVAVGQMKPIFDMVLKMVPRFEGPQSDKDTASYRDAAGNLANPAVPNALKKKAGKEILRLMKERKGQFVDASVVGTEADVPAGGVTFLGFEEKQ